jgi:hypothetical protein
MPEIISGIAAAIVIIFLSQLLSKHFTMKLIATTILVAIAFIYVGFALKNNPANLIILESAFALFLYFLALIGYKWNNTLIAFGIILHGIWDIGHHNGILISTDVANYWPSFCFTIDIIDGVYFFLVLKKHKIVNNSA